MADVKVDLGSQPPPQTAIPDEPPSKCMACGRQWHWAEVIFLVSVPLGLALAVTEFSGTSVPQLAVAIILAGVSALGMALIWNHATTKKLAETSEALKQTIKDENDAIIEAEAQNRRLAENNAAVRERLDNLKKSVDLLGGSVQNMAAVEAKLNEIFRQFESSQEKRRALNEQQTLFLKKQEEDTLDREKGNIKQRVKDQCEEADKDKDGTISPGAEMDKLIGFLAQTGIAWSGNFDMDGDGVVQIYEVMESLDKLLDAHFDKLKLQLALKADLKRELFQIVFELSKHKKVEEKKATGLVASLAAPAQSALEGSAAAVAMLASKVESKESKEHPGKLESKVA